MLLKLTQENKNLESLTIQMGSQRPYKLPLQSRKQGLPMTEWPLEPCWLRPHTLPAVP